MKYVLTLALLYLFAVNSWALQAFPEAEGFGSDTVGGRNGTPDLYIVNSLANDGSSCAHAGNNIYTNCTLREATDASGDRFVVFTTGGTIDLTSTLRITSPNLTIAGQTAPGGGITIDASGVTYGIHVNARDVVIRYLTVRGGNADTVHIDDASNNNNVYNVVMDHISTSWGEDEVFSIWYAPHDITVSYCLVVEGLLSHSMGLMLGGYKNVSEDQTYYGYNFSCHHNYIAHSDDRNGPYLRGAGIADVVNNIAYNPGGGNFAYAADENNSALMKVNLVKNYHKRGPDTDSDIDRGWRAAGYVQSGGVGVEAYVTGNYHSEVRTSDLLDDDVMVYASDRVIADPNTTGSPLTHLVTTRWTAPTVTEYDPFDTSENGLVEIVMATVGNSQRLDCDGTWVSKRDSHDTRVINDFTNGTGALISSPSSVGGYLTISAGTPCTDSDSDGMPDTWETANGLNPNDASDWDGDADSDGYLNIEEFINGSTQESSSTKSSSASGCATIR